LIDCDAIDSAELSLSFPLLGSFFLVLIFFAILCELDVPLVSESDPELELELFPTVVCDGDELLDRSPLFFLSALPSSHLLSLALYAAVSSSQKSRILDCRFLKFFLFLEREDFSSCSDSGPSESESEVEDSEP